MAQLTREEILEKGNKIKKDINKKFGAGANLMLSDEPDNVERISSGVYELDEIIGGGYALGRIVEVFGASGSGKCVPKNANILTPNGYKTVEEILLENELQPFCVSKTIEKEIELINRYGEVEKTSHVTFNARRPLIEIKTRSGFKIASTKNHPHLSISGIGNWVWKRADNLSLGDYLCVPTKTIYNNCESDVTRDEAYMVGVLIADAHFDSSRILITNDDNSVVEKIENSFPEILGIVPRKYYREEKNSNSWHFSDKNKVNSFYDRWGFKACLSKEKIIVKKIRTLPNEVLIEFIKGYFDCEASFCSFKNSIEVTSASYELLYSIKLILHQLGIISALNKKTVKSYPDNDYYRLYIGSVNARKYCNLIGSNSHKVQCIIKDMLTKEIVRQDGIPGFKHQLLDLVNLVPVQTRGFHKIVNKHDLLESSDMDATYPKIRRILNEVSPKVGENGICLRGEELLDSEYYYDQIVEIRELDAEPTFDFCLPNSHSFVMDGVVTHNTTISMTAIAEAQKQGLLCAMVDAECAFDKTYAESLGIDTELLLFSQPESGEEGLNIVENYVEMGVNLIVVDSVAALVPQAEIDGEMGENKMGLHSRLMSQAMRKLKSKANKTGCILIFINQVREKIGVMYGSNETTTGGRALEFYASLRLRVSREQPKDGSTKQTTIVRSIKNKTFPPFQSTKFDIEYGTGVVQSLLNKAVNYGIIKKKGGGNYYYNDELIARGEEKFNLWVSDNPDFEDYVKNFRPGK